MKKIKLTGKIMGSTIAILFLIGAYTSIATGDGNSSQGNTEISVHIPPIDRGENGVADIYIHLDSTKDYIRIPEKISVTLFSNSKKVKTLNCPRFCVQEDNTLHLHLSGMPDSEKAKITIYFPNNEITGQATIEQVPSPQKMIHIDSIKPDIDDLIPFSGEGWYECRPPFPDDYSWHIGRLSDAHADKYTGDGGVYTASWVDSSSYAHCSMYNTPYGICYYGMNGFGGWQIGVKIKDGYGAWQWPGPRNYAEVAYYCYEWDKNGNYVGNNYHRVWSFEGTDVDIDADIDAGTAFMWDENHCYRGRSRVYAMAGAGYPPAWIDLGEEWGDIDFEYITWFWLGA